MSVSSAFKHNFVFRLLLILSWVLICVHDMIGAHIVSVATEKDQTSLMYFAAKIVM